MRIKLRLSYDGRSFEGWQSQPGGNTIQDLLDRALTEVSKQPLKIHGSGRTDAGVHAFAQVAHFDPPDDTNMNPFNWVPALNAKLPAAIRVLAAEEVAADFHARFSAISKTYRYEISLEPVLSPFRAGLVWHLPRQLDPQLLEDGLKVVAGHHDFRAFAARRGNETESTDYRRHISQATLSLSDHGWQIRFTGDGFLYKMVRLMVGGLIQVAQGRQRLDDFAALLDQPANLPNGKSPICAPPDGLYLESVDYS